MTFDDYVRQRDELLELVRWALGESCHSFFPPLPDDWPVRKFYWRKEMRERLDAILATGATPAPAPPEPDLDEIAHQQRYPSDFAGTRVPPQEKQEIADSFAGHSQGCAIRDSYSFNGFDDNGPMPCDCGFRVAPVPPQEPTA